ncbi:42260_t:CDS:1, partial [Gigaspora margarita]
YTVTNVLNTGGDLCRIWAEDSNQNRIAGDTDYHECTNDQRPESFSFSDETYWVHAKVEGSFEDDKTRGPYNDNTCFTIYGDVDDWHFDQTE